MDSLQRGQQTGKAWLGIHLDCIIPIRFSVGGTDKGAAKYREFISDQLTVKVTGAEILQKIPQLIIVYEVCYNLPPGDSSEN